MVIALQDEYHNELECKGKEGYTNEQYEIFKTIK